MNFYYYLQIISILYKIDKLNNIIYILKYWEKEEKNDKKNIKDEKLLEKIIDRDS